MKIRIETRRHKDLRSGDIGISIRDGGHIVLIKFAKEDYEKLNNDELVKNVVEVIDLGIRLFERNKLNAEDN